MADYNISAEITADASGFESGIKKAQKASKNLSSTVSNVVKGLGKSGLVGALGAVGLASAGVSAVLGTVTKVAKKVAQTIDECSQAYRTQYQAEVALATAVNNNPYVDGTATKRLKEFASEMQKVSDVGDEQMLPMMADLIAKGRTEEETMQIMKVALDMSAGGAMSLDTAITQLNATLNGNVGRLGQQNSELKDLTEEELKQGKAVEILGEKYKGLSKATADSQKQLKNAVGDLKENMGQIFEQALAPMRNFFTEVITNLNNSITKSRELKSSMKEVFGDEGDVNLGASTDALNTAFTEILHKQQEVSKNYRQYIQLYGKYIDVSTDETALSYQSQITTLENQLKEISEELNKRRRESEEEKKRLAKEKADAEAQKELEKQKELRAKELVLENEWSDKLFAIRLERLEETRERELENEELTQEQRIAINEFYGNQILAMKIKQIEEERDEALNGENVTEETRVSINRYYENKILKVKEEENEKKLKLIKKSNDDEIKEEKIKLAVIIKIAQEASKKMAENIKRIAKNIVSTVKSVISTIGNIFTRIVEFNPDEALDNLLKFEDSVLTFFVETLPKLPAFFESAVNSIIHTIKQVLDALDFDVIASILESIIKSLANLVTAISTYINENAEKLTNGLVKIVSTIVSSIAEFIKSGGWKQLLNAILTIQKALETAITENIEAVVDTIVEALPDLIQMLIDSIVSASHTLAKLIKPILKLIIALIKALVEVAFSDEVLDASMEVIQAFIEAIVDILIKDLPRTLPKLIIKIVTFILKSLPKMATTIIKAFVKILTETNWGEVLYELFMAIVESFAELGKMIGEVFVEIVMSIGEIFSSLGQILNNLWKWIVDGAINFFQGFFDWLNNGWKWLVEGVDWVVKQIQQGFEWAFGGIKSFFDGVFQGIMWGIEQIQSAFNWLKGGWDWFWGGPSSWFGWATGTNDAPHGLALVGEQGPELVKFNGGEQVLNTRNTQKLLANAGKDSGNTFNVTFNNLQDTTAYSMMQQLKAYNRQMAINGII